MNHSHHGVQDTVPIELSSVFRSCPCMWVVLRQPESDPARPTKSVTCAGAGDPRGAGLAGGDCKLPNGGHEDREVQPVPHSSPGDVAVHTLCSRV